MTPTRSLSRHSSRVLAALLRAGGRMERTTMLRELAISRPTLAAAQNELKAAGLISAVAGAAAGGPGRPAETLAVTRQFGVGASIEVGHRHLRVGIVDPVGTLLSATEVSSAPEPLFDSSDVSHETIDVLDADEMGTDVLELAVFWLGELLEKVGASFDEVRGIAVGVPGPLTRSKREILRPTFLGAGWTSVDIDLSLRSLLATQFVGENASPDSVDAHILIENDANLGAEGEALARAATDPEQARDLLYVKVSSGIGAGLILDGRLFSGNSGSAGEIGHVAVPLAVATAPGAGCRRCGRPDCLEFLAGADAILAEIRSGLGQSADALTLEDVVRDFRQSLIPPPYLKAVSNSGAKIGAVLGELVGVLDPGIVVLGGVLAGTGPVLAESVANAMRERTFRDDIPVDVVPVERLARVALDGGASLVWNRVAHHLDENAVRRGQPLQQHLRVVD